MKSDQDFDPLSESPHSPVDSSFRSAEEILPQPVPPRFSPVVNVLAGAVFLTGVFAFLSLIATSSPLEKAGNPEVALSLTVSRTLDLETAIQGTSSWEQGIYGLLLGTESSILPAREWYGELYAESPQPLIGMNWAILTGESGDLEALRDLLQVWKTKEEPYPQYQRLLEAAYGDKSLTHDQGISLLAELAESLPFGWMYDRVALKLADKSGNRNFRLATEEAAALRSAPLLRRARQLMVWEFVVIVVGVAVGVFLWVRRNELTNLLKVGNSFMPPPWAGWVGAVVLLRGGAGGMLIFTALLFVGWEYPLLQFLSLPLMYIPLFVLIYRYLHRPTHRNFLEGFGLYPISGGVKALALIVPLLITGLLAIEWSLGFGAEAFGVSIHWTEWFDADLAWGTDVEIGLTLIEYALFAPFFEEITFRGVLFALFRRKYGFVTAAGLSATLFAVAHGYGFLGFTSVWLSGFLWAWGYEKTGSLLPAMLAHSANNLLVCVSVLMLLR